MYCIHIILLELYIYIIYTCHIQKNIVVFYLSIYKCTVYTKCFPLWTSVFFFFASPEACRKLYPFLSLPSVCDGSSWLMVELPANIWSFPAVSKLCTKVNCSNWNMEHVWSEYCATADTSSRVCLADSLMSNTTGKSMLFSSHRIVGICQKQKLCPDAAGISIWLFIGSWADIFFEAWGALSQSPVWIKLWLLF